MARAHAFIADIYSDAGAGQQAVLEAIRGVNKHVIPNEPWASIYYWYIPEDPKDGAVIGLEEYESERHHKEGHNTSKPFLNLVDTIGTASSKKEKLHLEDLHLYGGFTERSEAHKAGVVHVERFSVEEGRIEQVSSLLNEFAIATKKLEPETLTWAIFKSREHENTLVVFERFQSKRSLTQHQSSQGRKSLETQISPLVTLHKATSYREADIGFMKRH